MSLQSSSWSKTIVAELGQVVTGKTPPTKQTEFFGDEYPFITPTDITDRQRSIVTERYLSSEGHEYLKNYLLPPGAICFVSIGATIGKICMTARPSFTNQQINSIVVDERKHDPRFVYYLLRYNANRIKGIAGGAATPIVNKSTFSEVDILVPPLSVERKIGDILSAYDDLIENNTRRIKVLEEMARAIYREWFVHFRFPGHEKVKLVDSRLRRIPEGWEVKRLGDLALVNESSIKKGDEPSEINYVDIASVSKGQILQTENLPFKEAPGRARRKVKHGDIIWSSVRPNLRAYALILDPVPNLIVSTGFAVISPKLVPYTYLYQVVTTHEFVEYLVNHTRGAAYPAVNTEDFDNAKILVPHAKILSVYDEVVSHLFPLRQRLFEKNANLRCTRDLLLPKLISGNRGIAI